MKNYSDLMRVKDATTPEEMRAELFRLKRYDPAVCAVLDLADCRGMNAEDRYTLLAYNAVKAKNEALAHILELVTTSLPPSGLAK